MAKKSLSDLPEGMITEILLRLPVKSLLQCKSVCKPWLSTISNPHFIQSHTHHSLTTSRNNPTLANIFNQRLLDWLAIELQLLESEKTSPAALQQQQRQQRRRQLVNQALDDANAQDLSTSHLQFDRVVIPGPFAYARFISCCNGIICLSDYNVVYLWNPSIRQFKELPFPNPHGYINLTVGFGYDYISNDYKILRFVYKNRAEVVPIARVYHVNADRCKEFLGPILKKQIKFPQSNIVVNGVLYFDGGDELVSFDFHNEVFGLVPFPDSIEGKRSDVLDFEGSVAMVFESGPGVDLWTFDNVSSELSWTKKFNIEYGLDDLDTEIWLSSYLGAKQFYGIKLLNGNYFVYEILYDYEKKETKYYGLREEYVNVFATSEESDKLVRAMLEELVVPVHAAFKYTATLVSLDRFEPVENARDEIF